MPHFLTPFIDFVYLGLQVFKLWFFHDEELAGEKTRDNLRNKLFWIVKDLHGSIESILDLKAVLKIKSRDFIFWVDNIDSIFDLHLQEFHNQLSLSIQGLLSLIDRFPMSVLEFQ